jgi:hypothetical protein
MNNLNRKKRGANITNEQKTLLIEYMNKHPELVKGKLTSSFTLKDSVHLWNEISEILNSANGAKKDWKDWRKVNYFYINKIKLLTTFITVI